MAWSRGYRLNNGKYTISQVLGEGGFGISYLATDYQGKNVVIKTCNDSVRREPNFAKFQQDFVNEALRLRGCQHPHIVQVYELIQEGSLWCMVMEYISGKSLWDSVKSSGYLTEGEALINIQFIGEALKVVHRNGLLHRDLNPKNIMIDRLFGATLIDFGLAREFVTNRTKTHTVAAFPGFAPIEQYGTRNKRGAYTDVYGLAASSYYALTGQIPTSAPDRVSGIRLESPQWLNPQISNRINQAILDGMELYPENRPQSVQEWLNGLTNSPPPVDFKQFANLVDPQGF